MLFYWKGYHKFHYILQMVCDLIKIKIHSSCLCSDVTQWKHILRPPCLQLLQPSSLSQLLCTSSGFPEHFKCPSFYIIFPCLTLGGELIEDRKNDIHFCSQSLVQTCSFVTARENVEAQINLPGI